MNIRLLRRIRNKALKDYAHVDMFDWLYSLGGFYIAKECGTAGCIAGTACILMGLGDISSTSVATTARGLLELTPNEAERLFVPGSWDQPYRNRLMQTVKRTKQHGQVIADYIDYFTNGATVPKPRRKKAKAPPAPEPEAPTVINLAPAKAKQLA